MNKKQLIVMWVGIALLSIILVFPYTVRTTKRTSYDAEIGYKLVFPVTRTKLCIITAVTAGGLIVTLKKTKDDQNNK